MSSRFSPAESPFPSTPLVKDEGGRYIETSNGIGIDVLRRLLEKSMPDNGSDVRRYDKKARQPVSEGLAESYLTRLLRTPPLRAGYSYLDGTHQDAPVDLSRTASIEWDAVKQVEGDLLYIVDDVAFAIEVKAKSIAQQAQRGDITRLERELREVVGRGTEQALRVRRLMTENGGLWETPTTWLDLRHVREVRTILVVLDDFGPLGTQLDDLRVAGLVTRDQVPLILSLHDLAVISDLCTHPAEFLLYLRRRTDSDVMKYYRAVDELDLFMLFLTGDLFVEDDPNAVRTAHPTVTPVTRHDRKLRELSARDRFIGEEGLDLAAWYALGQEGGLATVAKPTFGAEDSIRALVSQLREHGGQGWLRLATRLLDLSGPEQRAFAKCIRTLRSRARTDGQCHDAARAYASTRGHVGVFLAVSPDKRAGFRAGTAAAIRDGEAVPAPGHGVVRIALRSRRSPGDFVRSGTPSGCRPGPGRSRSGDGAATAGSSPYAHSSRSKTCHPTTPGSQEATLEDF